MSRVKESITQWDWSFGEVREDFLGRSDTDIHLRSAKRVRNMRVLASGAITTRPGTVSVIEADSACQIFEALRNDDEERGIVPIDGGIIILSPDGAVEKTLTGLPWSGDDVCNLWVKSNAGEVIIGSKKTRPHVLYLSDCSVAPFEFAESSEGSTSQPYYNFNIGTEIQPNAGSGSVIITASDSVFSPDYVGTIIRYSDREIEVTGYISPTQINGNWIQSAPETYDLIVSNGSEYAEDQAVEGLSSGASGIVSDVNGNVLTVIVDKPGMRFSVREKLSGPSTSPAPDIPTISSILEVPPAFTKNWDEQVFSDWRGWPGYAEFHQNRLVFVDIPSIPNALTASQAGLRSDFSLGADDGSGIFETIRGDRLLYAVSAEDLLLFSEDGAYYLGTRDGSALTPLSFNPRRFSVIGSAKVEPVLTNDGVAYVSKCESRIVAAVLAGDVNRYWQHIHLSEYAPHLIKKPIRIGTTTGDSDEPEQYLFAINQDGTMAVMRWQRPPFEESFGWALWTTKGDFVGAQSIFCKTHTIVNRWGKRFIERFEDDVFVDGAKVYKSLPDVPEPKDGLSIYANCRYLGTFGEDDIDVMCYPDEWGPFQVGCKFEQELDLWPRRILETRRNGFVKQRNGRASVMVLNSASYLYNGKRRPHYDGHDDLNAPPPKRKDCHRFTNLGRTCHPCHEIKKPEPGPLTVLSVSIEVQG